MLKFVNRFRPVASISLLVMGSAIAGCSSGDDVPTTPTVPVSASEEPADDAANVGTLAVDSEGGAARRRYGGLSFEIPGTWQEIPDAPEVDSKYIIPTDAGDCEMTLTSMGGGLDANMNRWVGQVQQQPGDEPEWTTVNVAGIESRMVDIRGSFNSTVSGNRGLQENWRLIGIAVPQQRDFFVKLVGPREALTGLQDELTAFLKSGATTD